MSVVSSHYIVEDEFVVNGVNVERIRHGFDVMNLTLLRSEIDDDYSFSDNEDSSSMEVVAGHRRY